MAGGLANIFECEYILPLYRLDFKIKELEVLSYEYLQKGKNQVQ